MIWTHPLNRRGGRLAALSRFLRWQFAQRLMPTAMALPFVNGSALVAHRGLAGVTGNWYSGLHEPDEMAFALHLLRNDDLFVDVGANVGSYTILAAAGIGADVIACEPVPHTFRLLARNVAFNAVSDRVTLNAIGVSDAPGVLRFSADLDAMNHVVAEGDAGPSVTVEVSTLDRIVGERQPKLIKIDVEGHEFAVVAGAANVLSRTSLLAVIMETNACGERFGVTTDDLTKLMAGHDFKPYQYDSLTREFREAVGAANTIFIRDIDTVAAFCRAAPRAQLCNGTI